MVYEMVLIPTTEVEYNKMRMVGTPPDTGSDGQRAEQTARGSLTSEPSKPGVPHLGLRRTGAMALGESPDPPNPQLPT